MKMADYTDDEFESFVKHNRDLIEKLMTMQKDMTMNALDGGKQFGMGAAKAGMDAAKGAAESAKGHAENAAQVAKEQTEQAAGKAKEAAQFAKEQTEQAADKAKEAAHYAKEKTDETAEAAKEKTEEFMKTTYNMFTDPGVQKHFMAMGIEFMSGMSALMQKAPAPDFVKDAASGMESNWKQSTCRKNDECAARKAKAQKVKVDVDPEPERPSDVPKDIIVTDYTKTE